MTTFDPSLAAFDRPDHLGGALQQGLPRPMNPKLTWGVIHTFLIGGITGGIAPALILPKRFANFAAAEQMQYWHLAEWLRLQNGDTEAAGASQAASRVTPGIAPRLASIAFVIVALGIACTAISHRSTPVARWFALTLPQLKPSEIAQQVQDTDLYRHAMHQSRAHGPTLFPLDSAGRLDWRPPTERWRDIYHSDDTPATETPPVAVAVSPLVPVDLSNAFSLAMCGAALCWLIEINTHISRVRKFVGAFNQLSERYGVGAVRPPGWHLGIRPLWILGAAAICALGGYWAAPMMLAAAAHRRYIKRTSLRLRSNLARRQREVLLAKRPTLRVAASVHLLGNCPQKNCRAPYPPEALFCRRCGTGLKANT